MIFLFKDKEIGNYYVKEAELGKVRIGLATKFNIMGFHEYFKATKKLGKGNFAHVYLVNDKTDENITYAVKAFHRKSTF